MSAIRIIVFVTACMLPMTVGCMLPEQEGLAEQIVQAVKPALLLMAETKEAEPGDWVSQFKQLKDSHAKQLDAYLQRSNKRYALQRLFARVMDPDGDEWEDRYDEMMDLVCDGADPNVAAGERTLLGAVCRYSGKDRETVQFLLEKGADPNGANAFPQSANVVPPLWHAKTLAVAQLLLDYKADVRTADTYGDGLIHRALRAEIPLLYRYCQPDLCLNPQEANLDRITDIHPGHLSKRWLAVISVLLHAGVSLRISDEARKNNRSVSARIDYLKTLAVSARASEEASMNASLLPHIPLPLVQIVIDYCNVPLVPLEQIVDAADAAQQLVVEEQQQGVVVHQSAGCSCCIVS